MNSAILLLSGLVIFGLGYRYWGRRLFTNLFYQKDLGLTPAHEYRDNHDYIPTNKHVLQGHHFSSIAGAAPIVGPAVAAIWGWLPAFVWILFGVVLMGASHDMGTLFASMRYKGQSIGKISEHVLGPKFRTLFTIVIFFLVWMVIAVFALVIANLFIQFPASVLPVNAEILMAIVIGYWGHKKGKGLLWPSIIAQIMLLFLIYLGTLYPISLSGENALTIWIVLLLVYSLIASMLPVWVLLQPRDFINSHQLFLGLLTMILGVLITRPTVVAPAIQFNPPGAPPLFPALFITIACGAISGFHGLVSSGTTSKQVNKWQDVPSIGYGSMCGEGLLALLATLAVTTGFSSTEHWHDHYASWGAANGLTAKISAFVLGAGNFVYGLGIPKDISQTMIAVMIISFAATSLDTATRIQRYVIGEIGETVGIKQLNHPLAGSSLAVITAGLLMLTKSGGAGGLHIWPLFGATNQMLAGLSLMVIVVYLIKNKRPTNAYLIPLLFITVMTFGALTYTLVMSFMKDRYFIGLLGLILVIIQLWMFKEFSRKWIRPMA